MKSRGNKLIIIPRIPKVMQSHKVLAVELVFELRRSTTHYILFVLSLCIFHHSATLLFRRQLISQTIISTSQTVSATSLNLPRCQIEGITDNTRTAGKYQSVCSVFSLLPPYSSLFTPCDMPKTICSPQITYLR